MRVIVRMMVDQLLSKFSNPGKCKATAQWCSKFVAMYPQCADEGETPSKKTVSFLVKIIKFFHLRKL